ncbi:MAG: glycosyltransferase family 4 protein [Candidatus Nanohaloarchaea archaeon]
MNEQENKNQSKILLLGRNDASKDTSHLAKVAQVFSGRKVFSERISLKEFKNFNIVYAYNSYFPANLTPILARCFSKNLVYAPQAGGFHKLQSRRKNWLFRQILRLGSFEALRCISMWEYERYRGLGVSEDRLFYCPLGIDYDSFSEIRPSKQSRQVFSLANARRFKDIETQIRAVKSLREEDFEVHLNVIGGWADDEYRKEIENLIEGLDVKKHVTVHGFVDRERIFEIISNCEAFIHTSKFETQGLAIYEAAAAGFPICVSDVPVHNQNFERFKHPQGDHEALAEDIKDVFELNSSEKEEISEEMRDLAKDFSKEKEMERLNELFDELNDNEK